MSAKHEFFKSEKLKTQPTELSLKEIGKTIQPIDRFTQIKTRIMFKSTLAICDIFENLYIFSDKF